MNLYQTLGVDPTASQDEIKKAYRRLAQAHHPDKNNKQEAVEEMQNIQRAYDILGDPERRKNYDETGSTEPGPTPETMAKDGLARLFVDMANNEDADTCDFKKAARDKINALIRGVEGNIQNSRRVLINTDKARERLKRKTDGDPFLVHVLEGHARQTTEKIAVLEQNIGITKLMLKMLDEYEYTVESKNRSMPYGLGSGVINWDSSS